MALTPKNKAFLKYYLGRDTRYHGNATKSYAKAYDQNDERMNQSAGSRLANKPEIKALIDKYQAQAAANLGIDATFVLQQSVHLYDVAMGNQAVEVDQIDADGAVTAVERRELNLPVARSTLELIGRHTSIQAFQDNVEHTHTHRLEQALAARGKQVERKAEQRALPDIEGSSTQIDDDQAPGLQSVDAKETPYDGGQAEAAPDAHETSFPRAGATAK